MQMMGALCSVEDKNGEERSEGKASPHISHIPAHGRLHKMPQFKRQVNRSSTNWRKGIANREFTDEASYTKALEELQFAERSRAFDAQVAHDATRIENQAADIVKKIRAYDWERTYGASVDNNGQSTGKRTEGEVRILGRLFFHPSEFGEFLQVENVPRLLDH
jgi:adenosine deaminase CECR1